MSVNFFDVLVINMTVEKVNLDYVVEFFFRHNTDFQGVGRIPVFEELVKQFVLYCGVFCLNTDGGLVNNCVD